ncbi:MAG: type I DNA topoisomerase [Rhodospirillales bacterium]|nr:type I DNA topoisomerase [Rhodospirillales bacterium]
MDVVVVESPAKAKTINRYLGGDYTVLASYGHVRDLLAKDGSVQPDADFAMDWTVDPQAKKRLDEIAKAVRGARHLYLATDPDREGEAISWHVCEVLGEKKALGGVDVKRVAFNAITRDAILDAFANPRDLDQPLIHAYLARRALDYLVGFTLSPVLWRKLPGSRSAGRVQSVALRLICDREEEIEKFVSEEYWTVSGLFKTIRDETFTANLTHLEGRKLEKLSLGNKEAADAALRAIEEREFSVAKIERKQTRRNPAPPFITSTLQQEASRKLGFSASRAMKVAQRLYEGVSIDGETVGLITYMRTDGVQMAPEAVTACRRLISADYGERYLPEKPRVYKSKAKNAQEAHEAIRPTDVFRRPADVARFLDADQQKLYALIWRRTLACQMEAAVLDQVGVDVASPDRQVILRATGSVVAFDGFFKVYREGVDDADRKDSAAKGDDDDRLLPDLKEGEALERLSAEAEQHFTQPPPRFTEASLVKRLEELGIGRPSTYASILSVLQDRNYVRLDQRRFVPEDRGRLVTAFLANFFERYVAYDFTAAMEEKLDDVSGGRIDWKTVLAEFWRDFSAAVDGTKNLKISDVLDALDAVLGPHFFPTPKNGSDPRKCPACNDGRLNLKLGRYGAFIGCGRYPDCRFTRPLVLSGDEEADRQLVGNGQGRLLGTDPEGGQEVWLRKGPYGYYVQLGGAEEPAATPAAIAQEETASSTPATTSKGKGKGKAKAKAKPKPKRASLLKAMDPETVDLETALKLLALPRPIGSHPETGEMINAGVGRFGPYVSMGSNYVSLKDDDVLAIGLNRALTLIAEAIERKGPVIELGVHPADGKPVTVKRGRFGPYVQHGTLRATLPKSVASEDLTLEQGIELLQAKAARGGAAAKGGRPQSRADKPEKASPEKASPEKASPEKASKQAASGTVQASTKKPTKRAATPKAAPKRKPRTVTGT